MQPTPQPCYAESPWLSKQRLAASMQEFKLIPERRTARTANISQFRTEKLEPQNLAYSLFLGFLLLLFF